MNLIEALQKYDKVTCDEIPSEYYFSFHKDGFMWLYNSSVAVRPLFMKDVLFSNSYREWKGS